MYTVEFYTPYWIDDQTDLPAKRKSIHYHNPAMLMGLFQLDRLAEFMRIHNIDNEGDRQDLAVFVNGKCVQMGRCDPGDILKIEESNKPPQNIWQQREITMP